MQQLTFSSIRLWNKRKHWLSSEEWRQKETTVKTVPNWTNTLDNVAVAAVAVSLPTTSTTRTRTKISKASSESEWVSKRKRHKPSFPFASFFLVAPCTVALLSQRVCPSHCSRSVLSVSNWLLSFVRTGQGRQAATAAANLITIDSDDYQKDTLGEKEEKLPWQRTLWEE